MQQRLLVVGSNSGYQLGLPDDEDRCIAEPAQCTTTNGEQHDHFPPRGHAVVYLSSGANHTLALTEPIGNEHDANGSGASKQIWACGTFAQGQLGPVRALDRRGEFAVTFRPLDLPRYLKTIDNAPWPDVSGVEPKQVVCGWNCSYVVLGRRTSEELSLSGHDALISLGYHRDNTFGELGCRPRGPNSVDSAEDGAPSVHLLSFAGVLRQAGLDADAAFEILEVTAGLRHAVAALLVRSGAGRQARIIIAGWGSARQGQVGPVPKAAAKDFSISKRPGPAAAIVWEPQLIFDWKTQAPDTIRCKLRAGKEHTVVLVRGQVENQTALLRCIGSNRYRQSVDTSALVACGVNLDHVVDISCNWTTTHFLLSQQSVDDRAKPCILSCGNDNHGQLGDGSKESTMMMKPLVPPVFETFPHVHKMVSGSEHTLILGSIEDQADQVWGWGWNEHGNLAQPGQEHEYDSPVLVAPQPGLSHFGVPVNLWAGCGTTFILVQ